MRTKIFLLVVLYGSLSNAETVNKINFKVDHNRNSVYGFGYYQTYVWSAVEVEIESNWGTIDKFPILNGVAVGLRSEDERYNDGTYLTVRFIKIFEVKDWDITTSLGMVYGTPGTLWNQKSSKIRIYPVRNVNLPGNLVEKDAVLYPDVSVGFRRKFLKVFYFEPVVGMRFPKFGTVELETGNVMENREISPYVGMRLGLKIGPY